MLFELLNSLSHIFYMALHVVNSGSFPRPLTAAQERECLEAYHLRNDMEARNTLIEHNLRLVAHIIKKYYSSVRDQDDLISIGTFFFNDAATTEIYTKGSGSPPMPPAALKTKSSCISAPAKKLPRMCPSPIPSIPTRKGTLSP